MFTSAYLVEILMPKRTDPIDSKDKINLFAEQPDAIRIKPVDWKNSRRGAFCHHAARRRKRSEYRRFGRLWDTGCDRGVIATNLELLFRSVRKSGDEKAKNYDPGANLQTLHEAYPDSCIYLSMLGFKKRWHPILPFLRSS
jgi:hypothetical protein